MKDVAWLEDVWLIFLIFHTFVFKSGREDKRLDAVRGENIYKQTYGKLKKISSATSSTATSFKLGAYNLLYRVFQRFDSQIVKNSILGIQATTKSL